MEESIESNWSESIFEKNLPESLIWVPCVPNYETNTLVPLYDLSNFPTNPPSIFPKISRGGKKSTPWSPEEDLKLEALVQEQGLKNWSKIAKALNGSLDSKIPRQGKHCRERWLNHLDPRLNKGEWSYEEDLFVLKQQKKSGNCWSKISRALSGRTENAVKNRWNCLLKNFKQKTGIGFIKKEVLADVLIKELEVCVNGVKETIMANKVMNSF